MFNFLRPSARQPRLAVADVIAMVARGEMTLLDVRDMAEAKASGKAKGAVVIPLALLPLKADPSKPDCQLPADKPVAIYCATGARSGMAVQMLTRYGYPAVHNIGGLYDWKSGGGQIDRI